MHTSYVHKIPHHHQVVNTDARTRERVHEGPHARRRRTVSARSSSNALKKVLDFSNINSLSLLTHTNTHSHMDAFSCFLLPHTKPFCWHFQKLGVPIPRNGSSSPCGRCTPAPPAAVEKTLQRVWHFLRISLDVSGSVVIIVFVDADVVVINLLLLTAKPPAT